MAVATNLELTRLVASIGIARRVARRAEACPGATRTRERSSARLDPCDPDPRARAQARTAACGARPSFRAPPIAPLAFLALSLAQAQLGAIDAWLSCDDDCDVHMPRVCCTRQPAPASSQCSGRAASYRLNGLVALSGRGWAGTQRPTQSVAGFSGRQVAQK